MGAISNTYEQAYRAKKVTKLALRIKELGYDSSHAKLMDDREWGFVAKLADCNPPHSEETKVDVIAALEASERTVVSHA